jgi:hypothetical protein
MSGDDGHAENFQDTQEGKLCLALFCTSTNDFSLILRPSKNLLRKSSKIYAFFLTLLTTIYLSFGETILNTHIIFHATFGTSKPQKQLKIQVDLFFTCYCSSKLSHSIPVRKNRAHSFSRDTTLKNSPILHTSR